MTTTPDPPVPASTPHRLGPRQCLRRHRQGPRQCRRRQRWANQLRVPLRCAIIGIAALLLLFWRYPTGLVVGWIVVIALVALVALEVLVRPARAAAQDGRAGFFHGVRGGQNLLLALHRARARHDDELIPADERAARPASFEPLIDAKTKVARTYEAKVIFGCASTIGTAQILLNSKSEAMPRGLANGSDMVGRNLMDHLFALSTAGLMPNGPKDSFYHGRRPTGLYIPRFRNVTEDGDGFVRGYGYQGGVFRAGWKDVALQPGVVEVHVRGDHPVDRLARHPGGFEHRQQPRHRVARARVDESGAAALDDQVGCVEVRPLVAGVDRPHAVRECG